MANWERLAELNQLYVVSDFQQAGYRLMMEQVLYASDRRSRTAYDIIVKNFGVYRELFDRFGMTVVHNHHHSYLVATPGQYVAEKMRLSETRLALVLRRLYDDKMHAADIIAGEAFIDLLELERAYKDLLGRELPEYGELKALLQAVKRYGIARVEEEADEQPFKVVIRPGIVEVLGETALLQLAAHAITEAEVSDEAS
jgi:Domain of unknown function (DUF4194)